MNCITFTEIASTERSLQLNDQSKAVGLNQQVNEEQPKGMFRRLKTWFGQVIRPKRRHQTNGPIIEKTDNHLIEVSEYRPIGPNSLAEVLGQKSSDGNADDTEPTHNDITSSLNGITTRLSDELSTKSDKRQVIVSGQNKVTAHKVQVDKGSERTTLLTHRSLSEATDSTVDQSVRDFKARERKLKRLLKDKKFIKVKSGGERRYVRKANGRTSLWSRMRRLFCHRVSEHNQVRRSPNLRLEAQESRQDLTNRKVNKSISDQHVGQKRQIIPVVVEPPLRTLKSLLAESKTKDLKSKKEWTSEKVTQFEALKESFNTMVHEKEKEWFDRIVGPLFVPESEEPTHQQMQALEPQEVEKMLESKLECIRGIDDSAFGTLPNISQEELKNKSTEVNTSLKSTEKLSEVSEKLPEEAINEKQQKKKIIWPKKRMIVQYDKKKPFFIEKGFKTKHYNNEIRFVSKKSLSTKTMGIYSRQRYVSKSRLVAQPSRDDSKRPEVHKPIYRQAEEPGLLTNKGTTINDQHLGWERGVNQFVGERPLRTLESLSAESKTKDLRSKKEWTPEKVAQYEALKESFRTLLYERKLRNNWPNG